MKTDSAFNRLLTSRNTFTFWAWNGLAPVNRSHQTFWNDTKHVRAGVECLTCPIHHNVYFNKLHNDRINNTDRTEPHDWVTRTTTPYWGKSEFESRENLAEFPVLFSVLPRTIRICLVGSRKTSINLNQMPCLEEDIWIQNMQNVKLECLTSLMRRPVLRT